MRGLHFKEDGTMKASQLMSLDEIRQIVATLKCCRRDGGLLHLAIFRLSCGCGMRRKEISGLDLSDLVLVGPRPVVKIRAEITKAGRDGKRHPREIPLYWDSGVLDDLRRWVQFRASLCDTVPAAGPVICSLHARDATPPAPGRWGGRCASGGQGVTGFSRTR